ncbi:MAG: hypothetical protein AAF843_15515 [Bacteroidota bacterium]
MAFALEKLKNYRSPESYESDALVDIKLPQELAAEKIRAGRFLIFVVDDNPYMLQAINTQLSEITLIEHSKPLKMMVKNYATGRSLIKDLNLYPDLIILNLEVNSGIKNTPDGVDILKQITQANRYLPILVLGEFDGKASNISAQPDLKNKIMQPSGAVAQLEEILKSLVIE